MARAYLSPMVTAFKLLLPALIPSWAFFKAVEPSPRIEWRCIKTPKDDTPRWQEFRPRPTHQTPLAILGRLLWNPTWNETLFMVSLAERLMLAPSAHSTDEIYVRLATELDRLTPTKAQLPYLQFRLNFVSRDENGLSQAITHQSTPILLKDIPR